MKRLLAFFFAFQIFVSPAFAAIAFVAAHPGNNQWPDAGSTTIATGTPWSLSSGSFVPVCIRWVGATTVSSVTDTAGNTYVDSGAGRIQVGNSANSYIQLYYTYNATANANNSITVTFSGSTTYRAMDTPEYTGVMTSGDPKDTGNTGTATPATSVTSGAFTPTAANGMAFACVGRNGTTTGTTPDANYTERSDRDVGTGNFLIELQDRIGAPVSSQTGSASANSDNWAIIVYTFKAPASGRRPIAPVMLGE